MPQAHTKQHAHELIDRMAPGQVAAIVARSLANAPYDEEPVGQEEARDIAESHAAYMRGEVVSNEEVLAEFGLTSDDFERMG